jgi:bacterioferritin (cytochrome b1)
MAELDKKTAVDLLNRILQAELAGVVRYTHYSFLVFGHIAFRSCRGCANRQPSR